MGEVQKFRVFVSSTSKDMVAVRAVTRRVLEEFQLEPIMMEDFPALNMTANQGSYYKLREADLYLGLFGQRYGYIENGYEFGVTENEYLAAKTIGLDRICLVVGNAWKYKAEEKTANEELYYYQLDNPHFELTRRETDPVQGIVNDNPEAMQRFLGSVGSERIWNEFVSLADFESKLRAALSEWLKNIPQLLDPESALRMSYIKPLQEEWVAPRLAQIKALIEADTVVAIEQSRILKKEGSEPRVLTIMETNKSVLEDSNFRLIILGEPGTGKTTTLTMLAEDFLKAASRPRTDIDAIKGIPVPPIPFLFNLPDWPLQKYTCDEWIRYELRKRYSLSKSTLDNWMENYRIILMMDGLDQVLPENREQCVEEINEFLSENFEAKVVICSRTTEFNALVNKPLIESQIQLERLGSEQIARHLQRFELDNQFEKIIASPKLFELAQIPLYLNILIALARQPQSPFPQEIPPEDLDTWLFEKYMDLMFQQNRSVLRSPKVKPKRAVPIKKKTYDQATTSFYLQELAANMAKNRDGAADKDGYFYEDILYIEEIQPAWISNNRIYRWLFDNSVAIFSALIGFLIGYFAVGTVGSILNQSETVLVSQILGGIIGAIVGAVYGGTSFAVFSVVAAVAMTLWLSRGSVGDLDVGLSAFGTGLVSGFVAGVNAKLLFYTPVDIQPRQIIYRILVGIVTGSVVLLLIALFTGQMSSEALTDWLFVVVGLFIGIIPSLYIGYNFGNIGKWIVTTFRFIENPDTNQQKQNPRQEIMLMDAVAFQFVGFAGVMLLGVIIGLIFNQLRIGIALGLLAGITLARTGSPDKNAQRVRPNQGVLDTISKSLQFTALLFILAFGVTWILFDWETGLKLGVVVGAATWLAQGGYAIFQHLVLRALLLYNKAIPFNLREFLDSAVERTFLIQVNNGYQFMHISLQQYLLNRRRKA